MNSEPCRVQGLERVQGAGCRVHGQILYGLFFYFK